MKRIITAFIFCSTFSVALAQDVTSLRKQHYNLSHGLALDGYDAVAYFTEHKAVKGSKEFAIYHEGATYYFATADDKELFRKNPSGYEPQYGGWCAYAMGAKGEKVTVDPETFKIIDNKLFLFYNRFLNNTLNSWNKDEKSLHAKADQNWNKIYH